MTPSAHATAMDNESPIRVGFVGLGSYGRLLARDVRGAADAELVGIADVDPETVAEVGQALDVSPESQYTDFAELLDGEALDAVVVATPNGLHHDQITTALDRGLAVYCEKPLATTAADAHDLLRRGDAATETVMIGYQRHTNPAYDLARDRWALGDREPTFVTGEITHDWRSYYETMENWRMDPELSGGGHLLNVGTHVIDAILWTTGLTPTAVTAHVDFHDDEEVFDKQTAMIVEFEEGAIATISDTGVVARTREHVHIWDGEGAVYLEGREWGQRTGRVIDSKGTEHDPHHGGGQSTMAAFVEAIKTGEEPPATVHDGFRATIVTLAAYESGRRGGERVELSELYPEIDRKLLAPR